MGAGRRRLLEKNGNFEKHYHCLQVESEINKISANDCWIEIVFQGIAHMAICRCVHIVLGLHIAIGTTHSTYDACTLRTHAFRPKFPMFIYTMVAHVSQKTVQKQVHTYTNYVHWTRIYVLNLQSYAIATSTTGLWTVGGQQRNCVLPASAISVVQIYDTVILKPTTLSEHPPVYLFYSTIVYYSDSLFFSSSRLLVLLCRWKL